MRRSILAGLVTAALTCAATGQTTWYVDDDNCPGPGSGTEADPFCSIQDGIDAAADGDEIVVLAGTYAEWVTLDGKAVTLRSADGPAATFIVAPDAFGSIVACASGEGRDTVIQGFTVTGAYLGESGGGMYNSGSSPTVRDCIFEDNSVGWPEDLCDPGYGGGMANYDASPLIVNCTFVDNHGSNSVICGGGSGGGVLVYDGNPVFIACKFEGNSLPGWGGGLHLKGADCNAIVINTIFLDNGAGEGGAVKVCCGATALIANCTFVENTAWLGGGISCENAEAAIVNCTFLNNSATSDGGGLHGDVSVVNSVFWSNSPEQIAGGATATYSCVMSGWPGEGNIDADPMFVDPDDDDLRLQPGSPCIDVGNAALLPPDTFDLDGDGDTDEPLPLDLDGNPRVVGANVDMGAYEFQGLPCPADLDGDGAVDVTDLTAVILAWGTPDADVTGDGTTDVQDLVAVINAWGPCD